MGSPTIFSGKYTKLLTQKGLMQQGGAVNQFDGDRNYIKNSTFEANILDGWNRVKTTITSNLPTGTPTIGQSLATAPSIASFYVNGGSAPFDSYALYFGNPITTVVAGEGVISDAFTVEPGDLGKVLTFKLYYKSEYGASTDNWSGVLGSQTWAVYIYDQTAGAWLQPAGFLGMNQNSGVGIVSGTFQSSVISGQQYRIAVIALRNTTSTSALQIDNIYVGSQTAPIGPVVTDWVSYTPTGTWGSPGNPVGGNTNATYTGRWRRVGANGEYEIGITLSGAPNAATLYVALPSGQTIDTARLTNIARALPNASGSVNDASPLNNYKITAFYNDASSVLVTVDNASSTYSILNVVNNTVPVTLASGDALTITFTVPISGWSSNVQLSSDTDTRVVAFRATRTSSQSFPNAPASPYTVVQFDSIKNDTHGAWDSVNYRYTVPVSGFYDISARFLLQFAVATAEIVSYLVIDGVPVALQQDFKAGTANGNQGIFARFLWRLNAGQTVQVRIYQVNSGGGAINGVFELGGIEHGAMYVNRLSGPSVVAASETVAAIARKNTGSQTTPGSTQTVASWLTPDLNTHGAFNATTGIFTAPISGTYQFSGNITFGINGTGYRSCYLSKNSPTNVYAFGNFLRADASIRMSLQVNSLIYLNAGETCMLVAYQDSGGGIGYSTLTEDNHISIVRVGN